MRRSRHSRTRFVLVLRIIETERRQVRRCRAPAEAQGGFDAAAHCGGLDALLLNQVWTRNWEVLISEACFESLPGYVGAFHY